MSEVDFSFLEDVSERELESLAMLLEIRERRLEFALEYHTNTRGERMDFKHYPHIRELYETTARHLALMGSVQSMKSEFAVIDHFASAYCGMQIFFVIPKYDMRTAYVQNRVNRAVETVPEYRKIMGSGFFDSVSIKNFGKGVMKYVGSNVLADFKEFPADMIYVEEVDQCSQENVNYALDRMRASKYQFTRYLGNPTIKDHGIHAYYAKSDQREWNVECLNCGNYHELDWFKVVVKEITDREGNVIDYILRDKDWHEGCRRDIKCICPDCGGELNRASEKGKWVPTHPGRYMVGYHISMLCSLINSVAGMWDRFQQAIHDPAKMQHFFNSDLGLPFNAMGNKVTTTILDQCAQEGYNFVIKDDCAHIKDHMHSGPCSMGVDVGGVLDVAISEVTARGKRKRVYVGKVRTVHDLLDLIERYNVEKCVIDSMPESTLVQDFQEEAIPYDCDVWLCRYAGEGKDRRKTHDPMYRIMRIDRTEALDRSFASLRKRKIILPENYDAILNGKFTAEMCVPIRQVVEDDKGNKRFEWSRGKDHQRHADTYDMLAADLVTEATLKDIYVG